MRGLLTLLLLLLSFDRVTAATIEVRPGQLGAPAVVLVGGTLRLEDIEAFQFHVASLPNAVIVLHSDGGSLLAGIRIGTAIRLRNYLTLVPAGARCASACAIAWLGGTKRFMAADAQIGFHAAYRKEGGQAAESGAGNAVLGAYLNQIGLAEAAILYITKAAPNSMTWLTLSEAAQHNIEVHLFDPAQPPARVPPTLGPQPSPGGTAIGPPAEPSSSEADTKRGREFRDCEVCPLMVVIPAGEFAKGARPGEPGVLDIEGPQRRVRIPRQYAVGKFEVTFAEWEACVADGGCASNRSPHDWGWGRGRRPVINVSWHDAKEYVGWLSRKSGESYRLLSETEWEYAARAGTTTLYSFGDTISKSKARYSEVWGNTGNTIEAGSFPANGFGLHDMHGNVWEWVGNSLHPTESKQYLRGGSWRWTANNARSASRHWREPTYRSPDIGFRVARTL